jgi:hypothetical protein
MSTGDLANPLASFTVVSDLEASGMSALDRAAMSKVCC